MCVRAYGKGWRRPEETKNIRGSPPQHGLHPGRKSHFASMQSVRRPSARCVSDSSGINFTQHWIQYCEKTLNVMSRRTFCERAREQKSHLGNFSIKWTKQGREQLGSSAKFSEANWELACTKAWDLHKNNCNAKRTYVQACDIFFRPGNRTTHDKFVASRSDCIKGNSMIYCGQRRLSSHEEQE